MSVRVDTTLGFNVTETLETSVDGASSADIPFQSWVISEILDGTTANPVTKWLHLEHDLTTTSNILDIDLTSFTATNGATDNANGLQVRGWKLSNIAGVADAVITDAPTLPYRLLQASSADEFAVEPGHTGCKWAPTGLSTIGAGVNENIRITGACTVRLEILFG